jgi:hypothetical protein
MADDRIPTHFFSLTDAELELANVFINDGYHGDLYSLVECARILTKTFERN